MRKRFSAAIRSIRIDRMHGMNPVRKAWLHRLLGNSLICAMIDKSQSTVRSTYRRRNDVLSKKSAYALTLSGDKSVASAPVFRRRLLHARKQILSSVIRKVIRRAKRYIIRARIQRAMLRKQANKRKRLKALLRVRRVTAARTVVTP